MNRTTQNLSKMNQNKLFINTNSNIETKENTIKNFLQINLLDSTIFSLKLEIKKLQEELNFRKEIIEESDEKLKIKENEIFKLKENEAILEKELIETKKLHKAKLSDLIIKNEEEQKGIEQFLEYEILISQLTEANKLNLYYYMKIFFN